MFGCLVAGRLLQTEFQQIDETHAVFNIPAATSVNHVCVFLLGTVPFPDGYGATVHFYWPGKGTQLLGMLSNDKPSAIFRLRGTYIPQSAGAHAMFSGAGAAGMPGAADVTAQLGLSIEPLENIARETAGLQGALAPPAENKAATATLMAERVVKNLFNYLSSFVDGNPAAMGAEVMVPMGMIAKWYETFMVKVRNQGTGFLERQE